jgi:hypothetical protein
MESPQSPVGSNKAPAPRTGRRLAKRLALVFAGLICLAALTAFILSFFLDGMVRSRVEATMNSKLKGYHVALGKAHFQLVSLRLTLKNLVIRQNAHPNPPVADIQVMSFHLYWRQLFSGHVVGTVRIGGPRLHINEPQLTAEVHNKTPIKQEGWQDAVQSVYPFKIDRLAIDNGDLVYIAKAGAKPLHVADIYMASDNIRNIHAPNNVYPSAFWAQMVVFDKGSLKVWGHANYLMEPFAGVRANYQVYGVPLKDVTPASEQINMVISGGTLSSEGTLEYSPKITAVQVRKAAVDRVDLTYVSLPQTKTQEKKRVTKVGKTVQKINNKPSVYVDLKQIDLTNSRLNFKDEGAKPPYTLYVSDMNLAVTNFSNHRSNGLSNIDMTGKFMGSGAMHLWGNFLASGTGPQFLVNVAIFRTDLPSLNPLLRAQGKVEVAHGYFTLYSQLGVKNGQMSGYVKPLFSDLQVYGHEQEKNKGLLHKAKEAVLDVAAEIFKNRRTQKVATVVNLSGSLKNPNVSTWQAFVEVVRNAFIRAILPGFDRQLGSATVAATAAKGAKGG